MQHIQQHTKPIRVFKSHRQKRTQTNKLAHGVHTEIISFYSRFFLSTSLGKNSDSKMLSNVTTWEAHHFGRRQIGTTGIVAITVFSVLAICLCSGAIYLLAKNKNISDIIEDAADDGSCPSCDPSASYRNDIEDSSGSDAASIIQHANPITGHKSGVLSIHKNLIHTR
eukprot:gene5458-10975_t